MRRAGPFAPSLAPQWRALLHPFLACLGWTGRKYSILAQSRTASAWWAFKGNDASSAADPESRRDRDAENEQGLGSRVGPADLAKPGRIGRWPRWAVPTFPPRATLRRFLWRCAVRILEVLERATS